MGISPRPRVVVMAPSDFESFPVGGTTTFVRNILRYLDLPVTAVGLDSTAEGAARTELVIAGRRVPYLSLGVIGTHTRVPRRLLIAVRTWKARRRVRALQADIYYVHSPEMCVSLGKVDPRRVVYHMHGASTTTAHSPHRLLRNRLGDAIFRRLVDQAVRRSSLVVGVNRECGDYATQFGRRFLLLPTCVDTTVFRRADGDERATELRLCYVGRIDRVKGLPLIIDVVSEMRRRQVAVRLTVAGDGPVLFEVREYASRNGVSDRVEFLGEVDWRSLPNILGHSDVFLMASWFEGLPTAMLEAMACGAVVVAPALPGVSEVVDTGVNGLLYEVRDPAAIAGMIVSACDRLSELSDRAVETIDARYSARKVASDLSRELVRLSSEAQGDPARSGSAR